MMLSVATFFYLPIYWGFQAKRGFGLAAIILFDRRVRG
jgi:hypothetical protein